MEKNISKYFQIDFESLKSDVTVTFSIFLYFSQSDHLLLWKRPGTYISTDMLQRYQNKGIKTLWIHQDEKSKYEEYQNPKQSVEVLKPSKPNQAPAASLESKTQEGAIISEILESDTLSEAEKKELASNIAKELIQDFSNSKTKEEIARAQQKAKFIVQDIINTTCERVGTAAREIWKFAECEPEFKHSVNVSTYSVIFALAFGRIDPELLGDLALAGLLHDIGITQLPVDLLRIPEKKMSAEQKLEYANHVTSSDALIKNWAPEIGERTIALIAQHHEQFNGQGYPNHLEAFEFDDLSQLVAMADRMETLVNGGWDGVDRNVKDSFLFLESLETERNFPVYFNPDIFRTVMNWVKSSVDDSFFNSATGQVENQVKKVAEK